MSAVDCENCLYFDYDEEEGEICILELDEDEMARLAERQPAACPYFRFFDEYKMVQKQN